MTFFGKKVIPFRGLFWVCKGIKKGIKVTKKGRIQNWIRKIKKRDK